MLRKVLDWCRERIYDEALDRRRQRVRWWAALALLRALSSSPRAAVATLRTRAAGVEDDDDPDERGRRAVFDQDDDSAEGSDAPPGGDAETEGHSPERKRLLALAREVEALEGAKDAKLARAVELIQGILRDGFNLVVFCRFIPTVAYLAEALRKRLKDVHVEAITGELGPDEREARIEGMSAHARRVLVCTDCLSEGINLQSLFDAVMHYDLTWNPTRLEQREGRVDRYNQPSPRVRALLLYGKDNPVDRLVLDVIVRRHRAIQKRLGVSVPVPVDNDALVEALFEGTLLRKGATDDQLSLPFLRDKESELSLRWEAAANRESRTRTLFAQGSIKLDEVRDELDATRRAIGDAALVERFMRGAIQALGGAVTAAKPPRFIVGDLPRGARDAMGRQDDFSAVFTPPNPVGVEFLTRTHPVVDGLSAYVVETALDAKQEGIARRCGVIRTRAVTSQTFLLLLRLRVHLVTPVRVGERRELLAEELCLRGWRGAGDAPQWLPDAEVEALLDVQPDGNIAPDLARPRLSRVIDALPGMRPALDAFARERAEVLRAAHRRVRKAGGEIVRGLTVEPLLPVDVLGVYVYLPVAPNGETSR
ncbi:MAG: helicase-related protein [Polyangiales bacterium]